MVFRYIKPKFCHQNTKRSSVKYIINDQSKTFNDQVYPRIPFLINSKRQKLKITPVYPHENNAAGQLHSQAYTVTKLIRDERIVLNYTRATEIRPQVERLIVEAMRNGDRHRPTMALANFWLVDKSLIHKLFKELVPRYKDHSSAFTAMHLLGKDYESFNYTLTELKKGFIPNTYHRGQVVLELRGNNLQPIYRPRLNYSGLLTNILLNGARESYQSELNVKAAVNQPE